MIIEPVYCIAPDDFVWCDNCRCFITKGESYYQTVYGTRCCVCSDFADSFGVDLETAGEIIRSIRKGDNNGCC